MAPLSAEAQHALDAFHQARMGIDGEAPRFELLQHLPVGAELDALTVANAIDPDFEMASGGDARIELAQAARSRITRVSKERLARCLALTVDALKLLIAQVDFASHLHKGRWRAEKIRVCAQPQGHLTNRAEVGGHIFPAVAVAAGRPHGQHPILVGERDRQPIDFEFAGVVQLRFGRQV
jgi:hypothetical protein